MTKLYALPEASGLGGSGRPAVLRRVIQRQRAWRSPDGGGHAEPWREPALALLPVECCRRDRPTGAQKLTKNRSHGRIDPLVAAVMAVGQAAKQPPAARFDFTGLLVG